MSPLTIDDYKRISEFVKTGHISSEIADKLGCSIALINKARVRINKGIPIPKMGRPSHGPMSTFPEEVQEEILRVRGTKTKKGCRSIHSELTIESKPSESTIYRLLKSRKQIKNNREKPKDKPSAPTKATRPHEVWELDARGRENLTGVGSINFINGVDYVTGTYISVFPAPMETCFSSPSIVEYQTAMRLAMHTFGLPERVQTDHASVFFDNNHESPFPSVFTLWLVALGIDHTFSRKGIPQDQGSVEKSHQTIWNNIFDIRGYASWEALFNECLKQRDRLNNNFPSRALGNTCPFDNVEAIHSGRLFSINNEESQLDISRVYTFLSEQKWQREITGRKCFFMGGNRYPVPGSTVGEIASITFDIESKMFRVEVVDKYIKFVSPIKITKEVLMGITLPIPGILPNPNLETSGNLGSEMHSQTTTTL